MILLQYTSSPSQMSSDATAAGNVPVVHEQQQGNAPMGRGSNTWTRFGGCDWMGLREAPEEPEAACALLSLLSATTVRRHGNMSCWLFEA